MGGGGVHGSAGGVGCLCSRSVTRGRRMRKIVVATGANYLYPRTKTGSSLKPQEIQTQGELFPEQLISKCLKPRCPKTWVRPNCNITWNHNM